MARRLPSSPSLEYLRKEAKDILKKHAAGDASVCGTLRHLSHYRDAPDGGILQAKFTLQEVQHALAIEYGSSSWKELKDRLSKASGEPSDEFSAMRDLNLLHDRSIERLLRQVDTRRLAMALHGESEEVLDLFHRNMSRNAVAVLKDIIETGPFGPATQQARAEIVETANRLHNEKWIFTKEEAEAMNANETPKIGSVTRADLDQYLEKLPPSKWSSEDLIEFFKKTMAVALKGGLIALDGIHEKIDDEFLKNGAQLVIDGADTSIVREILEARKRTLIVDYERRLEMTITALEGLSKGYSPYIIEAQCRAFLPSQGNRTPPAG